MAKYVVKRDVPILDEHLLRDDDGNPVINFTPAKLEAIAARNNARIKATGDLIPLVIGHTKDGEDERRQPEIVGYAKDLKVKPFKKTGRKAIHAKFLFFKNKLHKARNFPRRSIELWLGDGKIDPISLLGATTPERDLGLLQLEKTGGKLQFAAGGKRKYQRLLDDTPNPETNEAMDPKALTEAVLKALEESAVWKWAESKMKEEEANPEGEGGEPGLDDLNPEEPELEGDELPEDEGDPAEEIEDEDPLDEEIEEEEEEPEEEPVRYSAPSGTNTSTPTFGAHNRKPSTMHKKSGTSNHSVSKKGSAAPAKKLGGVQKLQRSRGNDQLLRFQRTVARVNRENQELRLKFQRAERERDLMELAAAGYEFDPVEELDYCSQLPEDHYGYHLNRIKKRYQKAPVGSPLFDLGHSRNPSPAPAGRTGDQAKQIAAYALKKGISYEDALQEFDSEQTF